MGSELPGHNAHDFGSNFKQRGTYVEDGDLINPLALAVRLRGEVLVDVLKVRNCDVLLELFVQNNVVVD